MEPVLVEVGKKGAPAPVGGRHPAHQRGFHKTPVRLVHVEHVPGELVIIPVVLDPHPLGLNIVVALGGFQRHFVFREHVQGNQVRPPVIVDIGRIAAHGEAAGMPEGGPEPFREGPVPVVQVVVIVLVEIIAHIDVRVAVQVKIRNGDPQPVPIDAPEDPGFPADVGKGVPVISQEFVPRVVIAFIAERGLPVGVLCVDRMVQQVDVEVPVQVVVQESCIGAEGVKIQAIGPGLFRKGAVPVVDKELVVPGKPIDAHHGAEVDVQKAVPVNVPHDRARIPAAAARDPGLFGNVLEFHPAQVAE